MQETSLQPAAPRGAVVVLSWFGREDTLACIESVLADGPDLDVFVVDNGSFDGVLEAVEEKWPHVQRMQTGENLGFAGGMNTGIRRALERGATFVTVLNNDTIVPPHAIEALQAAAGDDRAVSPEVLYAGRGDEVWFGGGAIDSKSMLPHHVAPADLAAGEPVRDSEVLAGCCVTASAAVWRLAGLFDERFFLNFEDSEWSIRARRRGVALVVDPRVRIEHAVSASFARSPTYTGLYYYARNGLLFNQLAGGTAASALRFLRCHVVTDVGHRLRRDGWRAGLRAGVVAGMACWHHIRGRYGAGPAGLLA